MIVLSIPLAFTTKEDFVKSPAEKAASISSFVSEISLITTEKIVLVTAKGKFIAVPYLTLIIFPHCRRRLKNEFNFKYFRRRKIYKIRF